LWGRVEHFTPGEPYALMIETFSGDGRVRFDQVGHAPESFSFSKIQSDYYWYHFGSISGVPRPQIEAVGRYYGSQTLGNGHSWGGIPELVKADIDGDGLNDIQLVDGTWIGYRDGAIGRK